MQRRRLPWHQLNEATWVQRAHYLRRQQSRGIVPHLLEPVHAQCVRYRWPRESGVRDEGATCKHAKDLAMLRHDVLGQSALSVDEVAVTVRGHDKSVADLPRLHHGRVHTYMGYAMAGLVDEAAEPVRCSKHLIRKRHESTCKSEEQHCTKQRES